MADVSQYPGLAALISPGATVQTIEQRQVGGIDFLRVTETLDSGEGDQILAQRQDGNLSVVAQDNVVDFPTDLMPQWEVGAERALPVRYSGTMTDEQHDAVAKLAVTKVGFKTGGGPGAGSVACMWEMRQVVQEATGIAITQTNGTGVFYAEMIAGHMQPLNADDVPAGGIIIAPTSKGHVGHIGILGAGSGDGRLVYSNHSPSARNPVAQWEQNYTVGTFTAAHLAIGTFFFRLPIPAGADLLAGGE